MSIANAKNKKIRQVKPLLVIEPNLDVIDYKAKAIAAEPTGTGDTLCLDECFGRLFRASTTFVEKCILEYQNEYEQSKKRMEEDLEMQMQANMEHPECRLREFKTWNQLYEKLKLIPSTIGDQYAYSNLEECQVDLYFEYYFHTNDDYSKKFGEPIFVFGPCVGAYPERYDIDDI